MLDLRLLELLGEPKEGGELATGEDVDKEIPEFLVSWFAFSK